MKKTHSANIGGTVFQIDEDAYEKLQQYLQSIHSHFHFYPDVEEIVTDIEGRIAEQLLQRESAAQVVRMSDVDRVIEAMGRIEQFDESAAESKPHRNDRKLFRDPDDRIIAGVAAGLASYTGLSPLVVRLAFIALTLLFGTAVVAYLLLWALVPTAASTTDKLQMRGRALTLASIDQGIRDGMASIPRGTRNVAIRSVTAIGSLIHTMVVALARAIKWIAGVLVVGIPAFTLLTFTVILVMAVTNPDAPPFHPEFFASFGKWKQIFKLFAYLLFAIPLALVITTGLRLFWGVNRLNSQGLAGMLGLWVVSLLASAAIFSSSYPKLEKYWEEYPAIAEARTRVDQYIDLAATTSPLSDEQASALLRTLAAEYKRRQAEAEGSFRNYDGGPDSWISAEEEKIHILESSNQRILESAKGYLDAQQLALMQDSMTRYTSRSLARLDARREQQEQRKLQSGRSTD